MAADLFYQFPEKGDDMRKIILTIAAALSLGGMALSHQALAGAYACQAESCDCEYFNPDKEQEKMMMCHCGHPYAAHSAHDRNGDPAR